MGYGTVTVGVRYGDANGLNSLEILFYFKKYNTGDSKLPNLNVHWKVRERSLFVNVHIHFESFRVFIFIFCINYSVSCGLSAAPAPVGTGAKRHRHRLQPAQIGANLHRHRPIQTDPNLLGPAPI